MRTVFLMLVLLQSACAAGPVGYAGPTARPRPDAYTCATEQLTSLGYTVESANRETGQLRGSRQLPGVVASTELLAGLFVVASWWVLWRPGGSLRYAVAALAILSGLLCKETVLVLTLVGVLGTLLRGAFRVRTDEVPREGVTIRRRYEAARAPDGTRHLWVTREKDPAGGEVSSGLRLDYLVEVPDPA